VVLVLVFFVVVSLPAVSTFVLEVVSIFTDVFEVSIPSFGLSSPKHEAKLTEMARAAKPNLIAFFIFDLIYGEFSLDTRKVKKVTLAHFRSEERLIPQSEFWY
jgi:hypothetical protein